MTQENNNSKYNNAMQIMIMKNIRQPNSRKLQKTSCHAMISSVLCAKPKYTLP